MQSRQPDDEPLLPPEVLKHILLLSNYDSLASLSETCSNFRQINSVLVKETITKEIMPCINHNFDDPNTDYPILNINNTLNLLPQLITQLSTNINHTSKTKLEYFIFLYLLIHHIMYALEKSDIHYPILDTYEEELAYHMFAHIEVRTTYASINQEKLIQLKRSYSDYCVLLKDDKDLDPIHLAGLFNQLENDIQKLDYSRRHNITARNWLSCFGLFCKTQRKEDQLKAKLSKAISLLTKEFEKFSQSFVVTPALTP